MDFVDIDSMKKVKDANIVTKHVTKNAKHALTQAKNVVETKLKDNLTKQVKTTTSFLKPVVTEIPAIF